MRTVSRHWTVMTWNVRGTARPDLAAVAAVVVAEAPDALLLQEVRRSQAADLAERLHMRFTWARKHYPRSPALWWQAEGMALMTPHGLDLSGHTEISEKRSSWSWRRRLAQWALVARDDGSAYQVVNVHLSPHDLRAERRAEAVRVAEIVDRFGDAPPTIVAGDLNDDADASIVYALPGVEHITPPPTCPADAPSMVLDHVLLPAGATDVAVTVPAGGPEWARLSDHLPVTVRFALDWVEGDYG